MGTFTTPLSVSGPNGRASNVEALADTGATHTLFPSDLLEELGIEPIERVAFRLADERLQELDVGEARIGLDGRERTVLVVFGPPGALPLMGATTLELFTLAVDPVSQRLVPVPGLLKSLPAAARRLSLPST